jgi:cytochrome c oxidase subunit 2
MLAAAALWVVGCQGERTQSALHPAGPAAARIATLSWWMIGIFTAVFVIVLVLLAVALWRRAERATAPPLGKTGFIVGGGIIFPVVVLTPLYIYSLETSAALRMPKEALTIRVVGHQWWWDVRYPEHDIVTANELHIPAGRPVRLELASADVIHSFWVPELHGKRDMIPGLELEFWIQADKPGVYRGQCAEYCGRQHANMGFYVIALPPEEFDAWVAERQRTRPPDQEKASAGLNIFMKAGCATCHAIHGTPADGKKGPDLTHIGSRRSLGAAKLANTRGHLAGWIGDPQAIKPGVLMPRSFLPADDLMILVDYLEGLR